MNRSELSTHLLLFCIRHLSAKKTREISGHLASTPVTLPSSLDHDHQEAISTIMARDRIPLAIGLRLGAHLPCLLLTRA